MTDCSDVTMSLGAYALGTLEPDEEHDVEAHLAQCPRCLADVAALTPVAAALSTVSAADLTMPGPSAALFDRVTAAVNAAESSDTSTDTNQGRRSRIREPRVWLAAAAACAVLVAGGGVIAHEVMSGSTSSISSASAGHVHLAVEPTDAGSSTRLHLTVSGLPAHEHCRLVALAADGTLHDAGSWTADYDGKAQLIETTKVPRSQLRGLTLYAGGHKLIDLNV